MATPTAAPSDRIEETEGDVTYIRTDKDLPPVAIIDRSPITTRHKIIFGIIALLGAIAWAIIAFFRGETVNAVWFVIAAICTYVIGFRFYARLIEMKIVRPRDDNATPAEVFENDTDYMPTDRRVLFGHHFAAIAGAGPLVGPVLAMQMGYLPGTIWIIIGAVFAGCVQDYLVLWISTRRRGRSLGQMVRDELGAVGGAAAIIGIITIMTILLAVLALVVVQALAQSPWGVFSIAMTIPIALFMGDLSALPAAGTGVRGVADRRRPVAAGRRLGRLGRRNSMGRVVVRPFGGDAGLVPDHLRLRGIGAAGVAAARAARLPVDVHEGRHHRPARGRHPDRPPGHAGARRLRVRRQRPGSGVRRLVVPVPVHHDRVWRAVRFPFADRLRHHAEDAGEGKPDAADRLRRHADRIVRRHHGADHRGDPQPAPVLHPQRPRGATGGTAATAAEYVNSLPLSGDPITAEQIEQAARDVGEESIVSRTGGAPTLAIGMSEVLHRVFGGAGLKAFWYHFAIMFEALFILTTVDAGTRVARFMLSDGLSNLGGPLRKLRDPSWRVGVWTCSLAVVALWGSILLMGITDPLGGINSLFPLFGIANQLLAAIALTIVTVVVVKKGYLKWVWIPGVPLLWDLIVTLTASWQKIFSGDPRVGFWTQHFQYRDALDAGQTSFGSAKNVDAMEAVIRNTFIQGTLSIVFALMVVIVFGAGLIMLMRVLRGGGTPLTEDEPVASKLFAPSGLIPTKVEREVQKQWDALPQSHARSVGTGAH